VPRPAGRSAPARALLTALAVAVVVAGLILLFVLVVAGR
jgi:hypothetical protein